MHMNERRPNNKVNIDNMNARNMNVKRPLERMIVLTKLFFDIIYNIE